MAIGFSFRQTLTGSYWLLAAPTQERAMTLSMRLEARDVGDFARSRTFRVEGQMRAAPLASTEPVDGSIVLRLAGERRITCRLAFKGDDGQSYELSGVEEWSRAAPVDSLTVLSASLYDAAGDEIGRATLRFDLRAEWANWLKSLRMRWD